MAEDGNKGSGKPAPPPARRGSGRESAAPPPKRKPRPARPDPTRYGDWEKGGRCIDF